jgi:hypothetical protein
MADGSKTGQYIYLTRNPVTGEWREAGTGRKTAEVLGEDHNDIVYVRVPLRSWDPQVRESVTVTRVRTTRVDLNDEQSDIEEIAPRPNDPEDAE